MKIINIFAFISLFVHAALPAYDAENGKELYNSSKCTQCHDSTHFTSKERKVTNYKKLVKSVEACRYGTNADWFDEDRDDVVYYLNKEYYKYKIKK